MRRLVNLILIIIFIVGAIVTYRFFSGLADRANISADPIVGLVRNMVIDVTPVILPDPVTIVREVNTLARLETASFEGEKIIRTDRNQEMLWGAFGESLIFVAYGEVIAGVDLAQMQPEDIQVVDPQTVMVHLPESEVLVKTLNNERSYVVDRDVGLFTNADPQLETEVRITGENAILEAAMEYGILEKANENAENYMREFMQGLGFENVIFTEDTPPTPEVPYEQEVPKGYQLEGTPAP